MQERPSIKELLACENEVNDGLPEDQGIFSFADTRTSGV